MIPEVVARLVNAGETPAQALARIEASGDFMAIIASDEGQALLEYLADDALARRGGVSSPAPTGGNTDDPNP